MEGITYKSRKQFHRKRWMKELPQNTGVFPIDLSSWRIFIYFCFFYKQDLYKNDYDTTIKDIVNW